MELQGVRLKVTLGNYEVGLRSKLGADSRNIDKLSMDADSTVTVYHECWARERPEKSNRNIANIHFVPLYDKKTGSNSTATQVRSASGRKSRHDTPGGASSRSFVTDSFQFTRWRLYCPVKLFSDSCCTGAAATCKLQIVSLQKTAVAMMSLLFAAIVSYI